MRSDGITAHFGGEKLPPEFPPRFGVSVLWFTFEGDNAVYRFNSEGAVNFWEWRLDIFAPDGGHVLLSQDRYGPEGIPKKLTVASDGALACRAPNKWSERRDLNPRPLHPQCRALRFYPF